MQTIEIIDLEFDQNIDPIAQILGGVGLSIGVGVSFKPGGVDANAYALASGNTTFAVTVVRTWAVRNPYASASGGVAAAAAGAASGTNSVAASVNAVRVSVNRS
jgi:hypothetical protein